MALGCTQQVLEEGWLGLVGVGGRTTGQQLVKLLDAAALWRALLCGGGGEGMQLRV